MGKKVRIPKTLFDDLYDKVIQQIREEIISRENNQEKLTDNAIWEYPNGSKTKLFRSMLVERGIIDEVTTIDPKYLYKKRSDSNSKGEVTFATEPYTYIYFRFCDYKDWQDFEASYAQQVAERTNSSRRYVHPLNNLLDGYFKNTDWWLYFYGYEKGKRSSKRPYSLVRLIFQIQERDPEDISKYQLYIQNTEKHKEHIDYVGSIDLAYSSESILVCNLRNIRGNKQLHMKFNVDKTGNELYLGQYMNFEEGDEIISGSVLLHKIPEADRETAKPISIHFNDHKIREVVPSAIIRYFSNRGLSYRKTKAGVYSLAELQKWKDEYDQKRKDGDQASFEF